MGGSTWSINERPFEKSRGWRSASRRSSILRKQSAEVSFTGRGRRFRGAKGEVGRAGFLTVSQAVRPVGKTQSRCGL